MNIKDIKAPEDIKNYFLSNKDNIKYSNYSLNRPHQPVLYVTGKNVYKCNQTGTEFTIHGIGDKKIQIDTYWYTWETVFKAVQKDYTENSLTLNSFILYFFEGYNYKHYTENDIKKIVKHRKHGQYLTKQDIPKHIPVGAFKKYCSFIELPILREAL